MLDKLTSNWPTGAFALVVGVLFVLSNRGILSVDQVSQILAMLGLGGVAGAHRMEKP